MEHITNILTTEPRVAMMPMRLSDAVEIMKRIEYAGRMCYNSFDKITSDSYVEFITRLIERGHEGPLEHGSATAKITCSRACMAELTRHRLASFCVQSQRYVNYAKTPMVFVEPKGLDEESYNDWFVTMVNARHDYVAMINRGIKPQDARTILPNSVATELIMTANLREWRHILKLRTSPAAYPEMRQVAMKLLRQLEDLFPPVFKDILEGVKE